MFFYYQKTVTGKWTPVKNTIAPTTSPEGRKHKVSAVVNLVTDADATLEALSARYPLELLIKQEVSDG